MSAHICPASLCGTFFFPAILILRNVFFGKAGIHFRTDGFNLSLFGCGSCRPSSARPTGRHRASHAQVIRRKGEHTHDASPLDRGANHSLVAGARARPFPRLHPRPV